MTHTLETPDTITDICEVELLLFEYLSWAVPRFNAQNNLEIDVKQTLSGALSNLPDCLPPHGCTVLARGPDGSANAIGFYKKIRAEAVEIKRLYLRPEVRGEGLGRRLVRRLIDEARKAGYCEIYLDTADFMSSAHTLYRSEGFRDVDCYPEAEHSQEISPHVIYMALKID
jgi:GNAT superfamily N-acetyltransferase